MYVKRRGAIIQHHMATAWAIFVPVDADVPCSPPTLESWRARFPEFNAVPDAQVEMAIAEASMFADHTWTAASEYNCTSAIAWLAAHFLAQQLQAASDLPDIIQDGDGGTVIVPGGEVTSISFESMSVGFSPSKASSSGGSGSGAGGIDTGDLNSTIYGQRYLMLLKVNQPAVLVV